MNQKIDIILVEDNPSDAELAIWALKKNNMAGGLIHLHNGEEALDYVFCTGKYKGRNIGDVPKVMLLDVKMPKVGGLEVLRRLKEDERTKTIPVVLLTSSKEERDISEGYLSGANSYVVKPVEFENFVKAVSEIGLYWLLLNQSPH